ncbi:ERF family protein [Streptomyces sp. CNS654]|uniref:ERF family protein n=1 Tax=Streptomyces sp. CNS654 TaxID=1506995 RepID=UPI0005164DE4|nr:ERF family protein [Streptomyces sp. CNS654]
MTIATLPLPPAPATTTAALASPTYQPAPFGPAEGTPNVFGAIAAVMCDVTPVAKDQENTQQRYKFRGIDDVMSAMAGPLRAHGVFILPTIAAHHAERRGEKMTHVTITMRYHVYGPAGDCLIAEVPGEASDFADKATNKAQSAALKYLLFTLFMIPVDGRSVDDGDRDTPVEPTPGHRAERQQRQQQRGQRQQQGQQRNQRQQGGQQPRRSDRAEPGPWEQKAPAQQQRRDYLAEAERADNPHQFAKIRAAAAENGAPAEFLARLDAIDARKRQAAQQGQQATPHDDGHRHPNEVHRTAPDFSPRMERAKDPAEEAAEAENALRLAASRANLPTLDADFQTVYGIPLEQATAQQLNTFRAKIEAAGGAQ